MNSTNLYVNQHDFVTSTISRLYPRDYCVVVNPFFVSFAALDRESRFQQWASELTMDSRLRDNHAVCRNIGLLCNGGMIIHNTSDKEEALAVYDTFAGQDMYAVYIFVAGVLTARDNF